MRNDSQLWNRRAFLRTMGVVSLVGPSILLVGCQHQQEQRKVSSATPPSVDKIHTVQMVTDGESHLFDPDRLRLQPGDTVKWVLKSGIHTTTAYHPEFFEKPQRIPEKAEPWHSGVLKEAGQSFERRFDMEGVYDYYCTPHQSLGMVGIIVVGKALDGPGLSSLPDMMEEEGMMTEGMLYEREIEKLAELVKWAKNINP